MKETSPKGPKKLKSPKGKRAGPNLDKLMRSVQHMLLDPLYSSPYSELKWKRAWKERGEELGKRIKDCCVITTALMAA
jgi:hypothetical protein